MEASHHTHSKIMAIKLITNYSKKLGLPGYSSHSFGASVEVELTDLAQVEAECARLYDLLQHSVDQQIQVTGFVPDGGYGVANGHDQRSPQRQTNGNGHTSPKPAFDNWNCTPGQRSFLLRIVEENKDKVTKQDTEDLSNQ